MAAKEAVENYYKFKGKKLDEFIKENVLKIWDHFDVLKQNKIEIERGPQFIRMVIDNPELAFGIQW